MSVTVLVHHWLDGLWPHAPDPPCTVSLRLSGHNDLWETTTVDDKSRLCATTIHD